MKLDRNRFRYSVLYKNNKCRIVKIEDTIFGGTSYHLEDAVGNYIKRIPIPFKVSDYFL